MGERIPFARSPKPVRKLRAADVMRAGRRFRELFDAAHLESGGGSAKGTVNSLDKAAPFCQKLDRDIDDLATIILEFYSQWKPR